MHNDAYRRHKEVILVSYISGHLKAPRNSANDSGHILEKPVKK